MIILLIFFVLKLAFSDAEIIQKKPAFLESKLVDVFEVGYLKQVGMTLMLEDKTGKVLTKIPIPIYDNRSVACRLGFKSRCTE